jgi:DHA1 family bicyclomycin/chloramphenicol resistance-like MFS transporter
LAVAPVVGAWIIHFWGWRACFGVVCIVQAILLVWAMVLIQETNQQTAEFRAQFQIKSYLLSYVNVIKDKLFINFTLIVCGVFASYYSFISISSYMYIDEYHITSTIYSYTFIAIAAVYLLGNQVMLWMNREHASSWRLIKIGVIISVIGLGFILLGPLFKSTGWLILGLITWGVILLRMATAFINPPIQVAVTHHFGNNGAQALGLLACLQYISAGVGTFVVANLPWQPSVNLVLSSLVFCLVSVIGFYYCPWRKPNN